MGGRQGVGGGFGGGGMVDADAFAAETHEPLSSPRAAGLTLKTF